MSSDEEKKLTPAEIAYPPTPSQGGYVDHYVGPPRRPESKESPKPPPLAEGPPADEDGLDQTGLPKKSQSGWAIFLLAAVAVGGFLAWERSAQKAEPESVREVALRVNSEPPAHVYRRQLELGMTPLEIVMDETGADLELTRDGYQSTTVSFAGASPGAVKEVHITLKPVASIEPSASPQPRSSEAPKKEPTPNGAISPTATPQPVPPQPEPQPKPVAAQPPPPRPAPAAPAYRPPPRPVPPPQTTSGGSHRIQPPDF